MTEPNFRVLMQGERKARLEIYDQIGPSSWGYIDSRSVSAELSKAGKVEEIEVRLNSKGGDAFEGLGIYNLLKQHPAKVTVHVDGAAASAASLIAMAGDVVVMPKNTLLMIHNPVTYAFGGENELRAACEKLSKTKEVSYATYAAKSGKSRDDIIKLMDAETWMTGEEAVAAGFADRTEDSVELPPEAPASSPQMVYRNAPEQFALLTALTAAGNKPPEIKMSDPIEKTTETTTVTVTTAVEAKNDPPPTTMSAEQKKLQDDAAAGERKRAADVTALCSQAGKPDLAPKYIADGTPVMEVQGDLFKTLCKDRKPTDDGAEGGGTKTADPNAAYMTEYNANKAFFQKSGTTAEMYVASRRVDDGVDTLTK